MLYSPGKTWKELRVTSPTCLGFQQIKKRRLEGNEVLLKSASSGISTGTELRRFKGEIALNNWDDSTSVYTRERSKSRWPLSLGYENVGAVIEIGPKASKSLLGATVWSSSPHAEYNIIRSDEAEHGILFGPDDHAPSRESITPYLFLARTRIALAAVHDAELKLGESLCIIGVGVLGYLAAQLAVLSGAQSVHAIDTSKKRLAALPKEIIPLVREEVADVAGTKRRINGVGFDKVIECSGSYAGLATALKLVRKQGRVVTLGTYCGESNVDLSAEWGRNQLTLVSSMTVNNCVNRFSPLWNTRRLEKISKHLLQSNKIRFSGVKLTRVHFSQASEAYKLLECQDGSLTSVVFDYD